MSIELHRGSGHPWSGAENWDQLALQFSSADLLDEKIGEAVQKHWHIWIRDQARTRALLYKPSNMQFPWVDEPRMGTPRDLCLGIQVGDQVYTDFTQRITQHRVTARETTNVSQTGCMLRVSPTVQRSADAGNVHVGSNPWMDAAWFRPVYTNKNQANELSASS